MWIKISDFDGKGYYLKYFISEKTKHIFYITNFIDIWTLILSHEELSSLIKESNPLLEADDSDLINYFIDALFTSLSQKNAVTDILFQEENNDKCITLNVLVPNENIKICFSLQHCNATIFHNEVTIPLMINLNEKKSSEQQLIKLIKLKDEEIAEYKAEGAKLSLKHKKTKVFDESRHKEEFVSNLDVFSTEVLSAVTLANNKSITKAPSVVEGTSSKKDMIPLKSTKKLVECKIKNKEPNMEMGNNVKNIKVEENEPIILPRKKAFKRPLNL